MALLQIAASSAYAGFVTVENSFISRSVATTYEQQYLSGADNKLINSYVQYFAVPGQQATLNQSSTDYYFAPGGTIYGWQYGPSIDKNVWTYTAKGPCIQLKYSYFFAEPTDAPGTEAPPYTAIPAPMFNGTIVVTEETTESDGTYSLRTSTSYNVLSPLTPFTPAQGAVLISRNDGNGQLASVIIRGNSLVKVTNLCKKPINYLHVGYLYTPTVLYNNQILTPLDLWNGFQYFNYQDPLEHQCAWRTAFKNLGAGGSVTYTSGPVPSAWSRIGIESINCPLASYP